MNLLLPFKKILLVVGLVFSLFIAISFLNSSIYEEKELKIGAMLSLTGNWAELSKNIQQGLILANEEINAKGGVLNQNLNLYFEDTNEEKSGSQVVKAYRYFRSQDVNFFIGPIGAPGTLALSPIAKKDDVLLITPSTPGSFYKSSEKFFNTGGDNYFTTKAIAEHAYAEGCRKIAIFGSLQAWEYEQARIFREVFTSLGGTIVEEVFPEADQTSLKVEALKIAHSKSDAVFYAIFNQIALAAKTVKQFGYIGKQYTAQLDESHLTGSMDSLDGAKLFRFNSPKSQFALKYKNRFGTSPGIYADTAYDALLALKEAIVIAESLEPSKVRTALLKVKIIGSSSKPITFNANGLQNRGLVLHVVKNQSIVPHVSS